MATRRRVLAGAAAMLLGARSMPLLAQQDDGRIAIQLYTLRDLLARDLAGTLAALADIGYRSVQQSDLHGRDAAGFRAALDAAGLAAPSGHFGIPQPFDAAAWQATLAAAAIIGNRTVVQSYFGRSALGAVRNRAIWSAFAADLNQAGRMAGEAGMRLAYHNHDAEFAVLNDGSGATGFDVLLAETDPDLVGFEIDLYWLWTGAAEPWAVLDRVGPRLAIYHVKDRTAEGAMADIGAGAIDFAAVFARHPAGQYIVERDDAGTPPRRPEDALETARTGFAALSALLS